MSMKLSEQQYRLTVAQILDKLTLSFNLRPQSRPETEVLSTIVSQPIHEVVHNTEVHQILPSCPVSFTAHASDQHFARSAIAQYPSLLPMQSSSDGFHSFPR